MHNINTSIQHCIAHTVCVHMCVYKRNRETEREIAMGDLSSAVTQ